MDAIGGRDKDKARRRGTNISLNKDELFHIHGLDVWFKALEHFFSRNSPPHTPTNTEAATNATTNNNNEHNDMKDNEKTQGHSPTTQRQTSNTTTNKQNNDKQATQRKTSYTTTKSEQHNDNHQHNKCGHHQADHRDDSLPILPRHDSYSDSHLDYHHHDPSPAAAKGAVSGDEKGRCILNSGIRFSQLRKQHIIGSVVRWQHVHSDRDRSEEDRKNEMKGGKLLGICSFELLSSWGSSRAKDTCLLLNRTAAIETLWARHFNARYGMKKREKPNSEPPQELMTTGLVQPGLRLVETEQNGAGPAKDCAKIARRQEDDDDDDDAIAKRIRQSERAGEGRAGPDQVLTRALIYTAHPKKNNSSVEGGLGPYALEAVKMDIVNEYESRLIGPVIAPVGPLIGPVGPLIGPVGPIIGPVGPVIGPIGPITGPVGPVVGPIGPIIGPVGPVIGPVGPFIGPVGPLIGPVGPVIGSIGPIIGPVGPVLGPIGPIIGPVGPVIGPVGPFIGPIVGPVIGSIPLYPRYPRACHKKCLDLIP
ncbi:hypothetical protein FOCC_FOCC013517 [Frankliniella occidentalis]|nr:hypothetical protein FOCC_FOCC013517 [Frankliniella occidentalis]